MPRDATPALSASEPHHGRHLLVEYHGCRPEVLDDLASVEAALRAAASAASVRVVDCVLRRFAPQGVSGVLVIEESHLAIHTWPERGYAAVDLYTCGRGDPLLAHAVLVEAFAATRTVTLLVARGLDGAAGLAVVDPDVGALAR